MPDNAGFSLRDLFKPGDAHRHTLQRQIDVQARKEREAKPNAPGPIYAGESDYIQRHGEFFSGQALPDAYDDTVGPMTRCHVNSLMACEAHPELRYFTGFYLVAEKVGVHSWCVAPDGGVVETTFPSKGIDPHTVVSPEFGDARSTPYLGPEHWSYFGLEFKASFIRALIENYGPYLPVLDPICPFHTIAMSHRYKPDGWPIP